MLNLTAVEKFPGMLRNEILGFDTTVTSVLGTVHLENNTPVLQGLSMSVIPLTIGDRSPIWALKFPKNLTVEKRLDFLMDKKVMKQVRPRVAPIFLDEGTSTILEGGESVPWSITSWVNGEKVSRLNRQETHDEDLLIQSCAKISCNMAHSLLSLHMKNVIYRDDFVHNTKAVIDENGALVGGAWVLDFGNSREFSFFGDSWKKETLKDVVRLFENITSGENILGQVLGSLKSSSGDTITEYFKRMIDYAKLSGNYTSLSLIEVVLSEMRSYLDRKDI